MTQLTTLQLRLKLFHKLILPLCKIRGEGSSLSLLMSMTSPDKVNSVRNISTDTTKVDDSSLASDNETNFDSDSETNVEELQNVSRLSPNHYRQYHGLVPEIEYKDLRRRRMLLAKYGEACREDPRILWPSREHILDQEQEEKEEALPPLLERLAMIQAEKDAALKETIERRKTIEKNMSQMPKWIKEYQKKQQAEQKVKEERIAKKQVLLEEAREFFGYKIQPEDPKFIQMIEEREEKEKKEAKKKKKEDKLKKHAAAREGQL